jgi:hypothetical protein
MKFISPNTIEDIIWEDSFTLTNSNSEIYTDLQTTLIDEFNDSYVSSVMDPDRPAYFTVGFKTELEGCYQNVLGIFLLDTKETINEETGETEIIQEKYLLGLLTFLTEVIGEDERYRALLGNLGIPDPITYPNIFNEQNPNEEGVDWKLINKKSKELMLTYDEIFPYAGTYKALFGAINFLGYYDLIFKEWYRIKDQNNKNKFVTIQTYDL